MMNYLIPAFAFFLLIACTTSKKEEASSEEVISLDSLKSEVMAVHDEVMPLMGDLRKTRKELMALVDVASDSLMANTLIAQANTIAAANESMMEWMRAYEPDFEGTDEEVRNYLEDQKAAIQQVNDDMMNSWEKGKEMVDAEID